MALGVSTRVSHKLLTLLYGLATAFGFLASVPMVLHVYPQSECLLFSSQIGDKLFYGHHAICNSVAYLFLFVVAGGLYLMLKTWKEKKARERQSSDHFDDFKLPQNILMLHTLASILAAILTIVTTAGFVASCHNLHGSVSSNVQVKLNSNPYNTRGEEIRDRKEDDYKFYRHNSQSGNTFGSEFYTLRITCRSILTDPEIHQRLHDSHYDLQSRYYGFWYGTDLYAYDSQAEATKANGLVEASLAGGWLCLACWIGGLSLIILQKHLVKQQTKESNRMASQATMLVPQAADISDHQDIGDQGDLSIKKGFRKSNRGIGAASPSVGNVQPPIIDSYDPKNQVQMVFNQQFPQYPQFSNWGGGYVLGNNPNVVLVGQPFPGFQQNQTNPYRTGEFETEIF